LLIFFKKKPINKNYIIAFDQGITRTRTIIFDSEGKIIAISQKELKQHYPNSGSVDSDPILAYNFAKDFIKGRLKSPSTAEFPGTFEKKNHVTDLGNGEYRINSWVDSQNGFGAMIRSRQSCKIIFNGGNVRAVNIIIE